MDASEVEFVRMSIAESERRMMAELDARLIGVREELSRVADATAAALAPHVEESASEEPVILEGEPVEEIIEEPSGEIEVTIDGEVLEETGEVTELTPAEALDEIAPVRTHPFLRRINFGA